MADPVYTNQLEQTLEHDLKVVAISDSAIESLLTHGNYH